jgi:hypothetical protein
MAEQLLDLDALERMARAVRNIGSADGAPEVDVREEIVALRLWEVEALIAEARRLRGQTPVKGQE